MFHILINLLLLNEFPLGISNGSMMRNNNSMKDPVRIFLMRISILRPFGTVNYHNEINIINSIIMYLLLYKSQKYLLLFYFIVKYFFNS